MLINYKYGADSELDKCVVSCYNCCCRKL